MLALWGLYCVMARSSLGIRGAALMSNVLHPQNAPCDDMWTLFNLPHCIIFSKRARGCSML